MTTFRELMTERHLVGARTYRASEANIDALEQEIVGPLREQLNGAYRERDQLVAALARIYPSWTNQDSGAEEGWQTVVFVDAGTGQMSWHVPDHEVTALFAGIPEGSPAWDGHSTEEKYARLAKIQQPDSLLALQRDITAWAIATFGDQPITATVKKLRHEVDELLALPWSDLAMNSDEVRDELADVLFVLVQLAERTGVDLHAATLNKFTRNRDRRWERQPDGTYQHVPSISDLVGIAPDLTDGKPSDVWLDEQREAADNPASADHWSIAAIRSDLAHLQGVVNGATEGQQMLNRSTAGELARYGSRLSDLERLVDRISRIPTVKRGLEHYVPETPEARDGQ